MQHLAVKVAAELVQQAMYRKNARCAFYTYTRWEEKNILWPKLTT